jgi:UDP-N-acetylmuramoyl-L-alanyl-D-glutamate--2,6-diaminopimelate ligase
MTMQSYPPAISRELKSQMILHEALQQIPGIDWKGMPGTDFSGISYDSRIVRKGDLFVAIRGEKNDGARFVPQAIDMGAVAIASERELNPKPPAANFIVPDARKFLAEISRIFFGDPSAELKLVGITGTNGKTTVTYLMDSIFRSAGLRPCMAGTIGMKIGGRRFPSDRTTPESSDLFGFLRQAVTDGCTHGAVEVSSHSLVLKRVFGTKFTVGAFMNLTPDHLDFHRDMDSYFLAKQLFFSAENENRIEAAVVNADDAYGRRLEAAIRCPVMRFGFDKSADIHVLEYQGGTDGSDLSLSTPAGDIRLHVRLIGRPNIYNIMAASASALCLGIGPDMIRMGLEAAGDIPGRMERIDAGQDYTVIVDYAHSPDALENLLGTVSLLPHQRILTVFGCGGDRDRSKRPVMGEIAANNSSRVIATSDNPRSEDPLEILKEIESGLRSGTAHYEIIPDRRRAIETAIAAAREGDIVVIAGKGHEDYQIIGNRVIPFDDRKIARDLIRRRMKSGERD